MITGFDYFEFFAVLSTLTQSLMPFIIIIYNIHFYLLARVYKCYNAVAYKIIYNLNYSNSNI